MLRENARRAVGKRTRGAWKRQVGGCRFIAVRWIERVPKDRGCLRNTTACERRVDSRRGDGNCPERVRVLDLLVSVKLGPRETK